MELTVFVLEGGVGVTAPAVGVQVGQQFKCPAVILGDIQRQRCPLAPVGGNRIAAQDDPPVGQPDGVDAAVVIGQMGGVGVTPVDAIGGVGAENVAFGGPHKGVDTCGCLPESGLDDAPAPQVIVFAQPFASQAHIVAPLPGNAAVDGPVKETFPFSDLCGAWSQDGAVQ